MAGRKHIFDRERAALVRAVQQGATWDEAKRAAAPEADSAWLDAEFKKEIFELARGEGEHLPVLGGGAGMVEGAIPADGQEATGPAKGAGKPPKK